MIQKLKEWSGVIALVAIVGVLLFGKPTSILGAAAPTGTISYFSAISSQYGFYVGVYNTATQLIDDAGNFVASLKADAGTNYSYTNATSTISTTQTLLAADIVGYTSVIFTPNTSSVTLTFPASSTLSSFLPSAGDWTEQCWFNATSTAAKTITFAAGTGIDLESVATSTTSGSAGGATLIVPPLGSACFKYVRQPATAATFDISVLMTAYINAD